jgi:hypothetical protein
VHAEAVMRTGPREEEEEEEEYIELYFPSSYTEHKFFPV